jgi:hypothetical protein
MEWFNSSNGKSYIYYSNAWVELDSSGTATQTYANAAARATALPSPVVGMTTYLEDSKNLEIYDGSAFTSPSGMTLLATASPSASTEVIFSNLFSSAYQNYVIYFNLLGSTPAGVFGELRSGVTPATTNYSYQYLEAGATTVDANRVTTDPAFNLAVLRSTTRNFFVVQLSNPEVAATTSFLSQYQDNTLVSIGFRTGRNTNATSYDGIRIFASAGNMTGSIRVYGLRN